jgi:hypothetical protein
MYMGEAPPDPEPDAERTPCPEQDFTFQEGSGNYTAAELREIAQVAVGEASVGASDFIVTENEIRAIIATAVNRQNYNIRAWPGPFPFLGGTTIIGILSHGFDAYHSRSGEKKLAGAKRLSGGVLYEDDYVCAQLMSAKSYAIVAGVSRAGEIFQNYPFTQFRGRGLHHQAPRNARNRTRYADTVFWLDSGLAPL